MLIKKVTIAGIIIAWGPDNALIVDYPSELEGSELLDEIRFHKQKIINLMRYLERGKNCKCGSTETVAVPVHKENRTRLDCAQCGRFLRWGRQLGKGE